MIKVTLYGKPGCHLCEMAQKVIEHVRSQRPFELEKKNIMDDPADFRRFSSEIPLVMVNGKEIAHHGLTAAQLESALERAEGEAARG
jgi:glutaredoxin